VGGHDLDDAERELLDTSALKWLSVADVRAGRTGDILDAIAARSDAVHIHVDLDAHDVSVAPANSYAAPGGFTAQEVLDTIAAALTQMPLASATVASWDPTHDVDHRMRGTGLDLLSLLAKLAR